MTPPVAWCLRIAGASGIVNGLGFGGFAIPAIVSVGQGHGIIYTFGNPTYGNGPFERIGVPTTVPLLAGFLAACVVQVVGGGLLLWPRRSGIVVSVVGMLLRTARRLGPSAVSCCCGRVPRGSRSRSRGYCSARPSGGGSISPSRGSTRP